MTESPGDVARRRALRRMQTIATGLLVVAAIIFLATLRWRDNLLIGFINAGAEAAMVGALADWFAVVAIFRYPLGLKIPHTALVKRKKDAVGKSLETFVTDNFLTDDIIRQRVTEAQISQRIATWLHDPAHRTMAITQVTKGLRLGLDRVTDADVASLIGDTVIPKMESQKFSPMVGAFVEGIVSDHAHDGLMDIVFGEIHEWLTRHPRQFKGVLSERLPAWAPSWADRRLVEWAYTQAIAWAKDVRKDPHHRARIALDDLLKNLGRDLQNDETMQGHADHLKQSVLANPQFAAMTNDVWHSVKSALIVALEDQNSTLWKRADVWLHDIAEQISTDDTLRADYDRRMAEGAVFFMNTYGDELLGIISATIESWPPEQAADRIELFVGKDLQYIRINGTVVGSLAGIIIHAISLVAG